MHPRLRVLVDEVILLRNVEQDRVGDGVLLVQQAVDGGIRDIEATIKAIRDEHGADFKVGVVGYCLGGRPVPHASALARPCRRSDPPAECGAGPGWRWRASRIEATIKAIRDEHGADFKVGVVGYCLGGRLAFMTIRACASLSTK
jgi:dienelactone hydrolase